MSIPELKEDGAELETFGYSTGSLNAGVKLEQGATLNACLKAGSSPFDCLLAGYPLSAFKDKMKTALVTSALKAGFTPEDCKEKGFELDELIAAKVDPKELRKAFSADSFITNSGSAAESFEILQSAGFETSEIFDALWDGKKGEDFFFYCSEVAKLFSVEECSNCNGRGSSMAFEHTDAECPHCDGNGFEHP